MTLGSSTSVSNGEFFNGPYFVSDMSLIARNVIDLVCSRENLGHRTL
jgi:hypothetical protein